LFPVGVLAAIYMSEYVKDGWPKKIIKQMTNNLAGVPSIVLGF
jgi:phosphate transport system permease protein